MSSPKDDTKGDDTDGKGSPKDNTKEDSIDGKGSPKDDTKRDDTDGKGSKDNTKGDGTDGKGSPLDNKGKGLFWLRATNASKQKSQPDITPPRQKNSASRSQARSGSVENIEEDQNNSFPEPKKNFKSSKTSSEPSSEKLPVPLKSSFYNMSHPERGKCIIINNKIFENHTRMNKRFGTDHDADFLEETFANLKFTVERHDSRRVDQMKRIIENAAREDHTQRDCIVCCILTHGKRGKLFGKDGSFPFDHILEPFQANFCPSLGGKPKIFFIQACRGDKFDRGHGMVVDGPDRDPVCKIPNRADFLIGNSTVSGYYAWRNGDTGSWFIQTLCNVIKLNAGVMDLLDIMTIVNREVAYNFESYVKCKPSLCHMKQVPCFTSTLTSKIYFGTGS